MEYGKQNNLNIVSLKKEERTIACNAILIKFENNKRYFLLGRRAKNKSGGGQWGLIGGTQEKQEFMEKTLQRELFEEIGIDVEIDNIIWNNFFQCIATDNIHFDHHGFVITKWTGEITNKEPNKCDELRWFAEDELPFDNFFVSKGNLYNFIHNTTYDTKNNFHY